MPHEAIVERARAAEAAGFEGIAFMDHLAPPAADDRDMWEAMSIAAWVLAHTHTLVVGHLVLCDSMRHPAVLAREVASLDHASGGRFELGMGWGSVASELARFGVTRAGSHQRVGRLAESLAVVRALWTGEVVDFHGEHFTLEGARQRPPPTRRIPITIGGSGTRTLALVREYADWWNVPLNQLDRLDERLDAGGARVSVQQMVAFVPAEGDREEVRAAAHRRFGGLNPIVATAPELADHFARMRARGIERFYIWFADFAPPTTVARFAEVIDRVGSD
jgi:alkanesulfonate monooxygenase SsuD/methylene tetrahydromethanopterin reductase-like flavin-dependent oxidoreductase (luciferase family)